MVEEEVGGMSVKVIGESVWTEMEEVVAGSV